MMERLSISGRKSSALTRRTGGNSGGGGGGGGGTGRGGGGGGGGPPSTKDLTKYLKKGDKSEYNRSIKLSSPHGSPMVNRRNDAADHRKSMPQARDKSKSTGNS